MCFDTSCFENISQNIKHRISSDIYFNNNTIDDSHLYMLINRLCINLMNSTIDFKYRNLFLQIMEELTINHSSSTCSFVNTGNEKRAVKLLREYIEDNYKNNISSNQLSEISGLSSYYLIRLFSNEYGLAPHCYQNNIRIKNVKQLLMNGRMMMADIALEVGFADQSHMIKHFKKSVGITPSQYFQGMKK